MISSWWDLDALPLNIREDVRIVMEGERINAALQGSA